MSLLNRDINCAKLDDLYGVDSCGKSNTLIIYWTISFSQ